LSQLAAKTRSHARTRRKRVRKTEVKPQLDNLVQEKVTKQLLDLQILYLLRNEPQTLYSTKKALKEVFGIERSFGTIHPHLLTLEKLRLIEGREERHSTKIHSRVRKIYHIRNSGRSFLQKDIASLSRLLLTMTS